MAQCALDRSLLVVACCEASPGVYACYSHEEDVCMDVSDCLHRGCADSDDGVSEEAASDEDYFDVEVVDEFQSNGGTVCDDGRFEVQRYVPRELPCRCASIEDHDLSGLDHLCRCTTDRHFTFGSNSFPPGKVCDGGRRG